MCVYVRGCVGVCERVCALYTLPSVAGVPGLQPHYKSHKYHLTLLQQAGFDIKLSSRGVSMEPFSAIILCHSSGEESYTPAQNLLTDGAGPSTLTLSHAASYDSEFEPLLHLKCFLTNFFKTLKECVEL